jgi:hypothetical protein
MASFDNFLGQSWHDWAAHSEIHGHTQRTDKQKDAAQELVDRETPHLTMEKDIAISQSGFGCLLAKCEYCRQVVKVSCLRRHVQTNHPEENNKSVKTEIKCDIKTDKLNTHSLPIATVILNKADIKQEPNINNNSKLSKAKKRQAPTSGPINEKIKKRLKSDEVGTARKESRTSDRSIFFNRPNPVVIYGDVGSSEESDADESQKYHKDIDHSGITYINRLVQPMAFPRYGCYSDITKGSKVLPFSSAARQLNQQLSLISPSGPVLPGMEGPDFEGSSPMTPLSQPSPKLKPVLSQVRVQH